MYATDRQTSDVRRASSLNAPAVGAGHNKWQTNVTSGIDES